MIQPLRIISRKTPLKRRLSYCLIRNALWQKGYRYRNNYKELPGKPNIVLTKYKIVIFYDGKFFHGKGWEVLKLHLKKNNNSEFWINKISRNIEREDEINKKLLSMR